MAVTEYVIQNWALLLVLLGFATSLISTVFLEKKTVIRMYALIAEVLVLSILVFFEFYLADQGSSDPARSPSLIDTGTSGAALRNQRSLISRKAP